MTTPNPYGSEPSEPPYTPGYSGERTPYGAPPAYGTPPTAPLPGATIPVPGAPVDATQPVASPFTAAPTPYPTYPATQPSNQLAVVSLVLSLAGLIVWVTAPAGAICGHVALGQIRRTGQQGRGLALAGVIVGWIVTALGLAVLVWIVLVFVMVANLG